MLCEESEIPNACCGVMMHSGPVSLMKYMGCYEHVDHLGHPHAAPAV